MNTLTKKEFWDFEYAQNITGQKRPPQAISATKMFLKSILGNKTIECMNSYAEYFLWNVIFPQALPKMKNAKVVEIGCAPGNFLIKLSHTFDYIPYGVEYSETGVLANKQVFKNNSINPDNVIFTDFFSDEFHKQYKETFDIVISRGFVEHFTDPDCVVNKHLNLLKTGGYLIVGIPNLRGLNYFFVRLFQKEILPRHNLNIMKKKHFSQLFDKPCLKALFCGYYGGFHLMRDPSNNCLLKRMQRILFRLEQLTNLLLYLISRNKGFKNRFISFNLLYIGVKK